jgi:hypothetical protein
MPGLNDDDKISQGYESGHGAYQTADNLQDAEQSSNGAYGGDDESASAGSSASNLSDREQNSGAGWHTNLDTFRDDKGFGKKDVNNKSKSFLKKAGPTGGIVGLLLGMAGIVSFFGGPGLLIVNFVEQYTDAFNTQLASMDARMSRIVRAKLENTTKGCALPKSPLCKFSTFSETELKNFEDNKLTPQGKKETITGRYKITGFQLESGETVSAKDFSKRMKSDINFRNSMTKSYGGLGGLKLAGIWDRVANDYRAKRGINFARPFKDGSTDADRLKVVDDLSKGTPQTSGVVANACDDRTPQCSPEEREKAQADADAATQKANDAAKAGGIGTPEESASSQVGSGTKSFASVVKGFGILGAADSACAFIGFSRNVGLVTKTTRLRQMMLFSTIFLTTHSMIKSGDAVDQDVSFVGDMLTQTFTNDSGVTTKGATDSFGYRNAAYGDTGIDEAASPYIAGASFGGESSGVMQEAIALLGAGGTAAGSMLAIRKACKFVNNPLVVGGSMIVGIGALFLPGVNAGKVLGQVAVSGAFMAAQAILLAKLGDITNGVLVGKNDSREAVGNIMNVSSSSLLMGIGNSGGNPILSKTQATSVQAHYNEVRLAYAEMDRLNMSPLDPSSESTFVGSIYARMAPYIAKSTSISGAFSSIIGISGGITRNLLPPTVSAASTPGCEEQDPDIKDAGYATTEFCVELTGTDPKYLDIDPITASEYLIEKGYLDEATDEFTETAKPFIDTCIQRDTTTLPYGYSGENFDKDNGKGCIIDDSKISYFANPGEVKVQLAVAGVGELDAMPADAKLAIYIHTQDKRNNDILENDLPDPTSGSTASTAPTGTGVSGSDQELAKMILANKNIEIAPKYKYQFENYAKGDYRCHLSPNLLKLIASLGNTYEILVYSVNRACTNSVSIPASLHSANGEGNAVDIARVNGGKATGARPIDIQVYESAMAILPDKKLQLGQMTGTTSSGKYISCRPPGTLKIPAGNTSREIPDTCNHIHIGIYP